MHRNTGQQRERERCRRFVCVCLSLGVSPVGGHMNPSHPEPHDLKDDLSNIGQFCYFTVFYDLTSSPTDVLQLYFL